MIKINTYVNNTNINFESIDISYTYIKDYWLKNKSVPEELEDIIKIKIINNKMIIDWL